MGTYLSIRKLKHLAYRLHFSLAKLIAVSEDISKYYVKSEIKKKNGKTRTIVSIREPLKAIHAQIKKLLDSIEISDKAHGCVKGRSTLSNALPHCGKKTVYSLDFKSFFPSVHPQKVYRMFMDMLHCSHDVSDLLTKLTTFDYCLPQGSSVSPSITNILCRDLDTKLGAIAEERGISYTRYVDDITFSGEKIDSSFRNKIKGIIISYGFKLHKEKEILANQAQKQMVTGLCVNRKKPTVPKSYKRQTRAIIHKARTLGNLGTRGKQIAGRHNYVNFIEQ